MPPALIRWGSNMRRLLLFRHAKAERAEIAKSDEARVLTAEGRNDAAMIGAYLASHSFRPDRVLASPAARTRETWRQVAAALRLAPEPTFDERIYNAGAQTLLGAIKETPDSARVLLVLGHNPGLHELAVLLVATGDIDTRERLREDFPTAGLAIIDFAPDGWAKLHPRSGRLERFVSPKSIAAATN
jgi:phosphohistidine phosphatase